MKKGFIFLSIIFLVNVVFSGQIASAEEALPMEMSFSAAIKYSLENNNNIRAMRKGLSATERDIGITRSVMLPKVSFNEFFAATNNPTDTLAYRLNQSVAVAGDLSVPTLNHPPGVTNFLTSGILEQRILDKKSIIEIKMAKKEYSASGYFFLRKQEDLVNQVAQAYVVVITNQELVKVAEQNISDAKDHLSVAESKYKSKSGLNADVLRLKSGVEEREEQLVSAQRDLNVSRRSLGLLLGLEIAVEPISTVPDLNLHEIDYYKRFSVYRNDIKAAEIRVENSKNNIKSAQAEWYPTLSALGSYNFNNANFPFGGTGSNYIAGAFLKWVAIDGNKRKYEILKAKDQEAEAREYLEGFKKQVGFKIYEAYSKVKENQRNLELATEAQKQAEFDAVEVQKRWEKSQLPLVALTDAQINLNNTRLDVVKHRNELKSSLITLSYERGIIYYELALK